MDGFQKGVMQSLQYRLSVWLSATVAIVAVLGGLVSFTWSYQDAIELQDNQLSEIAALVDRQQVPPTSYVGDSVGEEDEESHFIVQRLGSTGQTQGRGEFSGLPASLVTGLQTVRLDDETWRIFVKAASDGDHIVVGQRTLVRDEIARDNALRTLLPFLVLIPALLLLISALVRRMLKPLRSLADELNQRSDQELHELAKVDLPTEIRPFVVAIDRLLARVGQSVSAQRRFVADAAHELRSPLTALSLQSERLDAADMSDTARLRANTLRAGIDRARQLLDQMLALARAQEAPLPTSAFASVQEVVRDVMEDLMPLTHDKDIDLGWVGPQDCTIRVSPTDLKTLVKNLVDNAVRYTPPYGRIDVGLVCDALTATLEVRDTGPGIALEERVRVLDPFYRILGNDEVGSGLGLSIVHTIAGRIGASLYLDYADTAQKTGLLVRVVFPLQPSSSK